jgi:hypothetical protein
MIYYPRLPVPFKVFCVDFISISIKPPVLHVGIFPGGELIYAMLIDTFYDKVVPLC